MESRQHKYQVVPASDSSNLSTTTTTTTTTTTGSNKKVVSGWFSICVAVTLFLLVILLSVTSSKSPTVVVNSLFQSYNNSNSNSNSNVNVTSSTSTSVVVDNNKDGNFSTVPQGNNDNTQLPNFTKDGNFSVSKNETLDDSNLGNSNSSQVESTNTQLLLAEEEGKNNLTSNSNNTIGTVVNPDLDNVPVAGNLTVNGEVGGSPNSTILNDYDSETANDYNCTVDFVASPFLVRESTYNAKNRTMDTLRIDLMDKSTAMYKDADVLVFNTGHWWTHEKTSKGEDYYQDSKQLYPRLKVLEAFKRAITTWARWVDKNVDPNRTQVLFRGYSVTHFRGGQWNSGGQCHQETEPIFNETFLAKHPSKMKVLENVLTVMKSPVLYMNISRLTDFRKDGHPSIYRKKYDTEEEKIAAVRSQDCSHWCLPGVPDTWNELLYVSLLKAGKGSWGT
ncbi:hypothetical protein ACFE04_022250 [Oxalis oulophora]